MLLLLEVVDLYNLLVLLLLYVLEGYNLLVLLLLDVVDGYNLLVLLLLDLVDGYNLLILLLLDVPLFLLQKGNLPDFYDSYFKVSQGVGSIGVSGVNYIISKPLTAVSAKKSIFFFNIKIAENVLK